MIDIEITAVSRQALSLEINGGKFTVPWVAVCGISVGRVPIGDDIWHLALAIDIEIAAAEHVVIVSELAPIWSSLTGILSKVFSDVGAVASWGPRALTASSPLSLYDRPDAKMVATSKRTVH